MALLPQRYPQKDFFVLDIADVVPKDDTVSMEHPIFSLATKPDHRHLHYHSGENVLEIVPSGMGLPTIFDKDILIFCISQLMHRKNRGEKIGKRVKFSARELLIATNRPTNNLGYNRLKQAFQRLSGTTFTTNIVNGEYEETRIFSLLESGSGFVVKRKTRRLDYCEVILSDWVMAAIESNEVVTISNDYFRLRRPLERRLYEIARKHCGNQDQWKIGLKKLQNKTGSNAPLKRFRLNLRQIIEEDHTPFYKFQLSKDDMVTVKPRKAQKQLPLFGAANDPLKPKTEEKGRKICQEKGLDYYAAVENWRYYANQQSEKGKLTRTADGSFIGWLKMQDSQR